MEAWRMQGSVKIVELQKNAACRNHKKYIICGVFPTIFLWIYINTQLFPTDSWYTSFYSDCSMKMKKKKIMILCLIFKIIIVCLIFLCVIREV